MCQIAGEVGYGEGRGARGCIASVLPRGDLTLFVLVVKPRELWSLLIRHFCTRIQSRCHIIDVVEYMKELPKNAILFRDGRNLSTCETTKETTRFGENTSKLLRNLLSRWTLSMLIQCDVYGYESTTLKASSLAFASLRTPSSPLEHSLLIATAR